MDASTPWTDQTVTPLIDTHCHLDAAEFDEDRDAVLMRTLAKGVRWQVIPGVRRNAWTSLVSLCCQHVGLYYALGLHPVYLDDHAESDVDVLEDWLARSHPVALGEIGLDYVSANLDRERQRQLLSRQLSLARTTDLPVILHVRKAHDDMLSLLRRTPVRGGVVHAFNGSLDQARHYIDLGFKLGFGGMLTFTRSTKLRRLAHELPLSALVLETDAPDMTVAQHRGERNSPEYLPFCLAALAEVRNDSLQVVAGQTTRNAGEVFNLSLDV